MFTGDDRGVSPVIGVILMVTITVILAAVIGTFVLGLGNQMGQSAPQASFSADFTDNADSDTLEITHSGGDKMMVSDLSVVVNGGDSQDMSTAVGGASEITAGVTAEFTGDLDSATVRIVWQQGGQDSAIVYEWEGPNA